MAPGNYKLLAPDSAQSEQYSIFDINTLGSKGVGDGRAGTQATPLSPGKQADGQFVIPPKLIHSVDPQFSQEARAARVQGVVALSTIITANGDVSNIHVIKSAGYGLDQQAIRAVYQYKFQPATKNGIAVPVQLNVEVNFTFSDDNSEAAAKKDKRKPSKGWHGG